MLGCSALVVPVTTLLWWDPMDLSDLKGSRLGAEDGKLTKRN